MTIRQAKIEDAKEIAVLLLEAMEEIVYEFIGHRDPNEAFSFMHHFTQIPSNQYSYDCCWVVEIEGKIVAAVNVYDGALLHILRQPIKSYVEEKYQKSFNPEDETSVGEYYLDSIGVLPEYRGKGIGSRLVQQVIQYLRLINYQPIGLLVEKDNHQAKKLYLRLGFEIVGEKTLVGKELEHLQYLS